MEEFDLHLWNTRLPPRQFLINQVAIDTRKIYKEKALFVALQGARRDGHEFLSEADNVKAAFALVKKGTKINLKHTLPIEVDDPLTALQEIASCYRSQLPAFVIAITGSRGKTLLKDLLYALLSSEKKAVRSPESFNSQLGVPLSLFQIQKEHEIAIIEAGISKKGEMARLAKTIRPNASILTCIEEEHIQTLKNLKTIEEEKFKLLSFPGQRFVFSPTSNLFPGSHPWDQANLHLPHATKTSLTTYSLTFPAGSTFEGKITFGFPHFVALVNQAVKTAFLLGISQEQIQKTLLNYDGQLMQTEIWKTRTGATFINEPYSADPLSVDLALQRLHELGGQGKKVFVFGGFQEDKKTDLSPFQKVTKTLQNEKIDLLVLAGVPKEQSLLTHLPMEVKATPDLATAVRLIKDTVGAGDVILIKGGKKESLPKLLQITQESEHNNELRINLGYIQENIETLREALAEGVKIMVMVKANAYGTDSVQMAKFLTTCGIDLLGCSYVEEGVHLKQHGVTQDIFVLNTPPYEAAKAVKWGFEIGVSNSTILDILEKEAALQEKKCKVHLHVDTGMSRFGCRKEHAIELAQKIWNSSHLTFEGLMSHYASSEDPLSDAFTKEQSKALQEIAEELKRIGITPRYQHIANSSGVIRHPTENFNMIRIALGIYGLYSSASAKKALPLKPALSLLSRIVGINHCKQGETISYGRNYTVKKKWQTIGVLPIGYFDGLHRSYSGKGSVLVHGKKAPMVGSICMDYMMCDLTDIPEAKVGDTALFFGQDEFGGYVPAEEFAENGGSIVHELITCLGPRIQRVFLR